MPNPKVIPPEREPAILERVGRGESADSVAVWLSGELGRKVNGRRVREFLERSRKERAPIAAAVIADKIGKTVGSDLDALQEMIAEAAALQKQMAEGGDPRGAVTALREKHSIVKTRLEMSGAGGDNPSQAADGTRDDLLAQIARLAAS